jgi:hypothetical protein
MPFPRGSISCSTCARTPRPFCVRGGDDQPQLQPQPQPQPQKAFPVSWDQFHRDARALASHRHRSGR